VECSNCGSENTVWVDTYTLSGEDCDHWVEIHECCDCDCSFELFN